MIYAYLYPKKTLVLPKKECWKHPFCLYKIGSWRYFCYDTSEHSENTSSVHLKLLS